MVGYYNFFVSEAKKGYVFDEDMSSMETAVDRLTTREKKERRNWNKTFTKIKKHYDELEPPKVQSKEGVLQQRMIAPLMELTDVIRRTGITETRQGCMYPHETHLAVWEDAEANVANYRLSSAQVKKMVPKDFKVFELMLFLGKRGGYQSETTELEFLLFSLGF